MVDDLLTAVQFLTRLPVPYQPDYGPDSQGRALLWFPLVGGLIGVILFLLAWIVGATSLSAALVVAVWVLITGGLHLDGLADSADAWVGGQGDSQRTLAIMKDPASGPAGVNAIVLVLLLKFVAIETLLQANASIWLILAPMLGRLTAVALLISTPYVREAGLGSAMAATMPRQLLSYVFGFCLFIVILVWGWAVLLVLSAVLIVLVWLRRAMLRRVGGLTGDLLGGVIEAVEVTSLVVSAWYVT